MAALHKIKTDELSVIVQGPIWPDSTRQSLRSIRTHLPGAEIVLSTWEGENVRELDYDVLVLSEDPGPIKTKASKASNLNRLLWSTKQGLKKATRPYGLKFRTDLKLHGSGILSYFGLFPSYLEEYKIFHERVVISSTLTWRTTRYPSGLYHPSDLFGLGRMEDLARWWSAPLFSFEDRARFENEAVLISEYPDSVPLDETTSEQYIWLSALQRTRNVSLSINPAPHDFRQDLLLFLNNFIAVELRRVDIEWLKQPQIPFGYQAPFLGFSEYRHLYRKEIEKRQFQAPLFSVLWKLIQLKIVRYSPESFKDLWRILKRIRNSVRNG
ncbi:WavE lipopolysaccharide synthesis family protein [Methylacidiphilales bacterium]|nr:WavE lipopolysaccharide synthesis family protein [Candidatus Methylacidiphilales bacterium]